MATLVSSQMRSIATAAVGDCGYPSAVLSGIVPDRRHLDRGGYHCSVKDLRRYGNEDDYSNRRDDDRDLNEEYGAAVDVSLSKADMVKNHKRVHAVWKDRSDPRRKYLNAINTWDGSGEAVRLDFVTNKASYASPDHTWHFHLEVRRRHVRSDKAARAVISVLGGESRADWVAREEEPPPPVPPRPPKAPVRLAPAVHLPGTRQLSYIPGRKVLRGEDVAFVQRFIGSSKAGPADGVFGARTRAAVRWYQGMRGLRHVDGIVGPATWRAMGVER